MMDRPIVTRPNYMLGTIVGGLIAAFMMMVNIGPLPCCCFLPASGVIAALLARRTTPVFGAFEGLKAGVMCSLLGAAVFVGVLFSTGSLDPASFEEEMDNRVAEAKEGLDPEANRDLVANLENLPKQAREFAESPYFMPIVAAFFLAFFSVVCGVGGLLTGLVARKHEIPPEGE